MITREPVYTDAPATAWEGLWRMVLMGLADVGRLGVLTMQALAGIPAMLFSRRQRREWVRQMYQMGIKSLPIISVVGMFTGMILGLQVGLNCVGSIKRFISARRSWSRCCAKWGRSCRR